MLGWLRATETALTRLLQGSAFEPAMCSIMIMRCAAGALGSGTTRWSDVAATYSPS